MHYGIVIIAAMGIAFFLPPVGVGLSIAAGIAGVDIDDVSRTYVPYLIALLIGLALIAAFPEPHAGAAAVVARVQGLGARGESPAAFDEPPGFRLPATGDCAIFHLAMARTATSDLSGPPPVSGYRLPVSKRALPMVQTNDCVVALRALGEDTRVRIMGLLMERAMDVTDISTQLGVSAYNVSKHLRVLREAGLLEVEKEGRQRLYALPDAIRRQAAAGRVLDLGCCSFQFEAAAAEPSGQRGTQRSQPKRRSADKQHARRK